MSEGPVLQLEGSPEPLSHLLKVSVREVSQAVVHQRRLHGG